MAIKVFPAFLLVDLACRRRWRTVAFAVIGCGAVGAVAAAVFGIGAWREYFGDLAPRVLLKYRTDWTNASLTGYWWRLFAAQGAFRRTRPIVYAPLLARALASASILIVGAMVARNSLRARTGSQGARDCAFAVALTGMLLASPITWGHYAPLLLLPLGCLWRWPPQTAGRRVARALVVLGLWMCSWCLHPWWGLDRLLSVAQPWQSVTVLAYQTYALLGLFWLGLTTAPEAENANPQAAEALRPNPEGRIC